MWRLYDWGEHQDDKVKGLTAHPFPWIHQESHLQTINLHRTSTELWQNTSYFKIQEDASQKPVAEKKESVQDLFCREGIAKEEKRSHPLQPGGQWEQRGSSQGSEEKTAAVWQAELREGNIKGPYDPQP